MNKFSKALIGIFAVGALPINCIVVDLAVDVFGRTFPANQRLRS